MKIPHTPFSTRLSGSAKETELRIRNIFQWKKKRPPVIALVAAVLVVVFCGGFVGFTAVSTEEPLNDESAVEDLQQDIGPVASSDQTPEFFSDIGKTLSELKNEHPEGEFIVSLDGFPDSAASCFGEQGAKYAYFFFGGHAGDFEKVMNECEEQLKCAGFITTANILFPDMEDDMSFEDFFSLIGVDDYEYFGEDTITAEGWLRFTYSGMEVMVNTNEAVAGGGWDVTGAERVKCNAPVSIVDPEISNTNHDLAEAVMFDGNGLPISEELLLQQELQPEPVTEQESTTDPMDAYERNGRLATMDGISHMPLDELPQEVLDSLTLVSKEDFDGIYDPEWGYICKYTAPGLELTTSAPTAAYLEYREEVDKNNRSVFPTEADFWAYIEGEEGREWLVNVTITDDKYATLDGLKVGMTCAQAETLGYSLKEGQNQIGNTEVELSITVENGTVAQMRTWWTMGRYIGKFFEL